MKRKKLLALVLSLAMTAGLAACGSNGTENTPVQNGAGTETGQETEQEAEAEPEQTQASDREVLRIGTMALSMGVPVLYAEEKGYFEEAGLNVSIELFATGAPIDEAIAAEEIDIAVSGFASVYSLANANCVWLADVNTSGGTGLYARPDSAIAQNEPENGLIGDAENLKGMQILGPLGTVVQYMNESYAAKYGLSPSDINQVNMEYASAYQAFTTGEGDAAASTPPYSYQLAEEGYTLLCSFEDATGVDMRDGCFARREIVENRSEEVQLFVNCLVKAMDELQDDELRSEYTRKVYDDNAISCTDEALAHEIEDRKYVGTEMMKGDGYILGEAWVAITDFLVNAEKITAENAPNVAASIDPTFVSAATGTEIKAK